MSVPMDRSRCQTCGQMVPVIEPGVHRAHRAEGRRCEGTHDWIDHRTYVYGDGTPHACAVTAGDRSQETASKGRPDHAR